MKMTAKYRQNFEERGWTIVFPWIPLGWITSVSLTMAVFYIQPTVFGSYLIIQESPHSGASPNEVLVLNDRQLENLVIENQFDRRWGLQSPEAAGILREALEVRSSEDGKATIITCESASGFSNVDIIKAFFKSYTGWQQTLSHGQFSQAELDRLAKFNQLQQAHQKQLIEIKYWKEEAPLDPIRKLAIEAANNQIDQETATRQFQRKLGATLTESSVNEGIPLSWDEARHPEDKLNSKVEKFIQTYLDYKMAKKKFKIASSELASFKEGEPVIELTPASELVIVDETGLEPAIVSPNSKSWGQASSLIGIIGGVILWHFYLSRWRDPEKARRRREEAEKRHDPISF